MQHSAATYFLAGERERGAKVGIGKLPFKALLLTSSLDRDVIAPHEGGKVPVGGGGGYRCQERVKPSLNITESEQRQWQAYH